MAGETYRWIQGEEMELLAPVFRAHGWTGLNPHLSRARCAFDEYGELVGFLVLQMIPHTEPLYIAPKHRGSGVAEALTKDMVDFLRENEARGWLAIAQSPYAAALCEKHGMKKIEHPVYLAEGIAD